jgi:transcriptional regulator with XRE-family HTH domain
MTREKLAETLDVATETVWRYESGRLPLSLTMLYRVADALGVPVEMLVQKDKPRSEEAELVDCWRHLDAEGQRALLVLVRWASRSGERPRVDLKQISPHEPKAPGAP